MWQARLSCVIIIGLSLTGCAASGDRASSEEQVADEEGNTSAQAEALEQLQADFNGPGGLMEFFSSSSAGEVRELLALYGMEYVEHAVSYDDKNIADCPQYFPAADRNTWHSFDGEYYYIDGSGRPKQAYKYLPPIAAAARSSSCQTSIGQWGDAEDPSNDYDGGHLIGSQLGGWGKRANIVPQDANFNRGNWVQLENAAADCGALSSGRLLLPGEPGLFEQQRAGPQQLRPVSAGSGGGRLDLAELQQRGLRRLERHEPAPAGRGLLAGQRLPVRSARLSAPRRRRPMPNSWRPSKPRSDSARALWGPSARGAAPVGVKPDPKPESPLF